MTFFRLPVTLLFLFCAGAGPARADEGAKIPIWIDTDPYVAPGGHNIDDGLALMQAFHSPELEVRGVSVVFGNADVDKVYAVAQQIVRNFGPPSLQVYEGASGTDQLGVETAASRALAEALDKGELTILALGPVTNVATVLKNHPELVHRVREVIAVAGRRPDQRFRSSRKQKDPFRDFDFELDPQAFQALLDSGVEITLTPWEVSSKVWLKEHDLKLLAEGNDASGWLWGPAEDWLRRWRTEFGTDGFNPSDTLAVGYVLSPTWFDWEDTPVEIRSLPDDIIREDGKLVMKPYLLASKRITSETRVRYCYSVKAEFKKDLMNRLLRK